MESTLMFIYGWEEYESKNNKNKYRTCSILNRRRTRRGRRANTQKNNTRKYTLAQKKKKKSRMKIS